jgi:hypothetical protein
MYTNEIAKKNVPANQQVDTGHRDGFFTAN